MTSIALSILFAYHSKEPFRSRNICQIDIYFDSNCACVSNSYTLEVVCRGSERQYFKWDKI